MNKQELLDKAVHELRGVLPSAAFIPEFSDEYFMSCNSLMIGQCSHVCSSSEFQQRARELGYINGYRWGVEYPTNGKKPDLPEGTLCDVRNKERQAWYDKPEASSAWRIIDAFRIVDLRYKPADTSYLDAPAVEPDSWYCYETQKALRLPPVGVEFESFWPRDTNPGWNKGTVSYSSREHLILTFDDGEENYYHKTDIEKSEPKFRPLDWNRKAEAERKRVVDAAYDETIKAGCIDFGKWLNHLHDKGYLRLPADKS